MKISLLLITLLNVMGCFHEPQPITPQQAIRGKWNLTAQRVIKIQGSSILKDTVFEPINPFVKDQYFHFINADTLVSNLGLSTGETRVKYIMGDDFKSILVNGQKHEIIGFIVNDGFTYIGKQTQVGDVITDSGFIFKKNNN